MLDFKFFSVLFLVLISQFALGFPDFVGRLLPDLNLICTCAVNKTCKAAPDLWLVARTSSSSITDTPPRLLRWSVSLGIALLSFLLSRLTPVAFLLQPKAATSKTPAVKHKFIIDYSKPAADGVFDGADFEKFLHDRIKVEGKAGQLGESVKVTRESMISESLPAGDMLLTALKAITTGLL